RPWWPAARCSRAGRTPTPPTSAPFEADVGLGADMAGLPAFKTPDVAALTARLPRLPPALRPPALSGRRAERLGLYAAAVGRLAREQLRAEWAGSPPHLWLIARPKPQGLAAAPVEPRPPRERRGKAIASGRFV